MMTDREREKLTQEVSALAHAAHVRQDDVEAVLRPIFRRVRDQHPDEDHLLLELWDRFTGRRVV
jgi:hypothetical protein